MYKYYSRLEFFPIKKKKKNTASKVKNHNGILYNIPHLIKNSLYVDCLQYGSFMYNDKVKRFKREVIPPIIDSMIPVICCEKKHSSLNLELMI